MKAITPEFKAEVSQAQGADLGALDGAGDVKDLDGFLVQRGSTLEDAKSIVAAVDEVVQRSRLNRNRTPAQVIRDAIVADQGSDAEAKLQQELTLAVGDKRIVVAEANETIGEAGTMLANTVMEAHVTALEQAGAALSKEGVNLGDFNCVERAFDEPLNSPGERAVTAVVGGAIHRAAKKHHVDMSPKMAGGLATMAVKTAKAGYKLGKGDISEEEALDEIERTAASVIEMLLVGGVNIAAKTLATFTGFLPLESLIVDTFARYLAGPVARLMAKGVRKVAEVGRRVWTDVIKPAVTSVWNKVTNWVKGLFA